MLHECYIYMSWLLPHKGSTNIYMNVTLGMHPRTIWVCTKAQVALVSKEIVRKTLGRV
jgi:hypothetical protein